MIFDDIKSKLYVNHIVLVISDLSRTKEFYSKIFGAPDKEDEYLIMYDIGETKLFFVIPYGDLPPNDRFNPNRIGLEQFAIGIRTPDDLKAIEKMLNENTVKHSGVHLGKHSKKEKIWVDDPDGIR